jgi:hypothetical protein
MLLSVSDILKRGKIKNVEFALDDGDAHYPSGHWANMTGTRMYSLDRIEEAEYLIDHFKNDIYYHENADLLNKMRLPLTDPYIIFDYRIIAKEIRHLFESDCRPYLPSFHNYQSFINNRRPYVIKDLLNIANYSFHNKKITNESDLLMLLDELVESSLNLYPGCWPNAIARKQILKKNIFKGKSKNAAIKILKIIFLIKNKHISTESLSTNSDDIFELLAVYPVLRIDHKIYNA